MVSLILLPPTIFCYLLLANTYAYGWGSVRHAVPAPVNVHATFYAVEKLTYTT